MRGESGKMAECPLCGRESKVLSGHIARKHEIEDIGLKHGESP